MTRILLLSAALSALTASAAPARILWSRGCEKDELKAGARIFTDRNYAFNEPPANLKGQNFLRGSIMQTRFTVVADGELVVLTPQPVPARNGHPVSAAQGASLAKLGFVRDAAPLYQLWGGNEIERAETWRKQVKAGERYDIGKFAILVGFDGASAERSPADVKTETLYNGVKIAVDPRDRTDMTAYGEWPLPVPYLENPPAVIDATVGRQLFVDDFLVADTTMVRTWHKAQKDRRSPVLTPQTDLERGRARGGQTEPMSAPFSGGVWYDGTDGLFKCFYCAGWFDGTAYAYSKDGFEWIRPELKAVKGTNRLVAPTIVDGKMSRRDSAAVVMDPDAPDGMRFKMLIWSRPQGGELFVSKDGLDWSEPHCWGNCSGDRSTIFYNPFRRMWVYSIRSGWHSRSRAYAEAANFLDGVEVAKHPVPWLRADNRDEPGPCFLYADPSKKGDPFTPALYNFDSVAYESLMLGVFTIMQGPENNHCAAANVPKMTELHLAFSRDGFHYSRPDDRSPFIGAGRKAGAWDRGYLHSNAGVCLVVGDELWFYYTGFAGKGAADGDAPYNGIYANATMGLARLRRDGFASMDAGADGAFLLTRPLTFTAGERLFVNANAAGGELAAEILDGEGRPLEGFTRDACRPVTVNACRAELVWNGKSLATLRGQTLRVRFHAREAQLYSFWFGERDGASRGWLAGGALGHHTLHDVSDL